MAKYHTYTSTNDTGLLHANEITKDYWLARQTHLSALEKALEDLSQQAKIFVKNSQDLPSYYDGMVDQIKAVDISGITFPVSALNWRKVLIDNGITIPFFGEWV